MRVLRCELKKIFKSPFLYLLLIVFLALNIYTAFTRSYYKEDFKVLNTIVDRFGYKVDAGMLKKFSAFRKEKLSDLNTLSEKRTGRSYKSAYAFLQDDANYKTGLYSQKEMANAQRLNVCDNYYAIASGIDAQYAKIDIKAYGADLIKKYGLTGAAAATARGEYAALSQRFSQLRAAGEEKNLFFIGQFYEMHSFLFGDIFRLLIFEAILLIVLVTGFAVNYEFDGGTQQVAYSARRGRCLLFDKLVAALAVSLLSEVVLIGGTLAAYFSFYDYSRVYNVPIATAFLYEPNQYYFPFFNLTFIQYLFAAIAVAFGLSLVFFIIAFCLSTLIKNSYGIVPVFAIIYIAALLLMQILPKNSNLIIYGSFNPFIATLNPHLFFMEKGPLSSFKYYEIATLAVWLPGTAVLAALCGHRFKKSDIA